MKNIQMTATVPEDLQISLGKLSTDAGTGNGYANNMGNLVNESGTTDATVNNGGAQDPGTVSEYWANTVDVSKYYKLGKIMPASSTDGQDIFFTPDAAGVGKTLKTGAKYYTAVDNSTTKADATTAAQKTTGKEYTQTYEATLHAIKASDDWTADDPTSYSVTLDAGYYVDIPVWIRSSCKDDVYLSVDAYVTTNSIKDDDDLYLAARAVILDSTKANTSKLLEIKEDNYSSFKSIVNFMDSTNATGEAVASISAEGGTATYGTVTHYNGSLLNSTYVGADTFKVAKSDAQDGSYGAATKVWVRVWLEGEDPNCWNDNAGQDFNISLKFTKEALVPATNADGSAPDNANYPMANSFTAKTASDAGSVVAGDTLTVTGSGFKDANDAEKTLAVSMTYTYNGSTWERTYGSYPTGKIKVSATYDNEAALITYLNTLTKKSDIASAITIQPAE